MTLAEALILSHTALPHAFHWSAKQWIGRDSVQVWWRSYARQWLLLVPQREGTGPLYQEHWLDHLRDVARIAPVVSLTTGWELMRSAT